jgi:LuxR family maltose regulon positive regulatory protein
MLLIEIAAIVARRPGLGALAEQAGAIDTQIAMMSATSDAASGLTSAELRVLPLLQTHLSFREIGDRQFVSRNTIKTQAISIYRKLGVSSRSSAVDRAAELGLTDADVRPALAESVRSTAS